mgnify:FL=1
MKSTSKTLLSSFLLITSIFMSAHAATTLIGTRTCSDWIKSRSTEKSPNLTKLNNETWLLGYLSGLSSGSGKDALKNTKNSYIFTWMDTKKKKNITDNISDGGVYLFLELENR